MWAVNGNAAACTHPPLMMNVTQPCANASVITLIGTVPAQLKLCSLRKPSRNGADQALNSWEDEDASSFPCCVPQPGTCGMGQWLCGCSATSFTGVTTRDSRLNLQGEGQGMIFDKPVEAKPKSSHSLAVFLFHKGSEA